MNKTVIFNCKLTKELIRNLNRSCNSESVALYHLPVRRNLKKPDFLHDLAFILFASSLYIHFQCWLYHNRYAEGFLFNR